MSTALDAASLVMIPSGYEDGTLGSLKPIDGSGDFTFTRGTDIGATRVAPDGYIEKGYENLLTYSNVFNQGYPHWATSGVNIPTGNQSGYDGSSNAWLLERNATNGFLYAVTSQSGVNTFSVYAKANTADFVALREVNGYGMVYFDLSDGTIGTSSGGNVFAKSIDSVGNGWYRCSIHISGSSLSQVRIHPTTQNGSTSGTSGSVYIQDAQLNQGLVAMPYLPTTTTTSVGGILANQPRIDFTGGGCGSLLLEPSRTNLVNYSEYFGAWGAVGSPIITTNATISPEGLVNATKFIPPTGASTGLYIRESAAGESFSVFAKAAEKTKILIYSGVSQSNAYFDLDSGEVLTILSDVASADIKPVGTDGWYRCSVTWNTTSTLVRIYVVDADNSTNVTGNGSDGLYLFGAQCEAGAYPTSLIPTYGTSVTRAVDVCGKTGVSSLIGQSEGTIYWEGYIDVSKSSYGYFPRLITTSSTSLNWMGLLLTQSNQLRAQYVVSGSTDVQITHQISTSGNYKIAFAYNDNDFNCFVNGVSVGTNTSVSTTIALDDIYLGMENRANNAPTSQDTKQVLLFKTRLSDAELAELTTI